MIFDEIMAIVLKRDDGTSVTLENGARFIGKMKGKGDLAYFHKLPPPAGERVLETIETKLDQQIPKDYRNILKRTNGPRLFEGHLSLYGAEDRISRSLRLEDQVAISILFENELFAVMNDTRWETGWMKIGSVTGWSTQLGLIANVSGQAAIMNDENRLLEFSSLRDMLMYVVNLLSIHVPDNGLEEGQFEPLDAALNSPFVVAN